MPSLRYNIKQSTLNIISETFELSDKREYTGGDHLDYDNMDQRALNRAKKIKVNFCFQMDFESNSLFYS